MSWGNDSVLEFLEIYQAEPVLWDPSHKQHKNRNAVADAWQRIQVSLGLKHSIAELKKKRESLMSTYRLHRKKINDSSRSGASADDIYKTNWFAYEFMDSFLGLIYNKMNTHTVNTEIGSFSDRSEHTSVVEKENDINEGNSSATSQTTTSTPSTKRSSTKRPATELINAKKQMDEAVNALKTISRRTNDEPDEVDLFCKLLAKKIKKFNEQEQEEIMHEIDETIYNKRNHQISNSRSSMYSFIPVTSPSPNSVSQLSPSPSSELQEPSYVQIQPHFSIENNETYFSTSHSQPRLPVVSNIIQEAFGLSEGFSHDSDHG